MSEHTPKKPRLNYEKCEQCRKDKKSCHPVNRSWPGARCQRCIDKDFACGPSSRKNPPQKRVLECETSLEPDRLIDSFIIAFKYAQEIRDFKLMAAILHTPFRNDQDVKNLRTFIFNQGLSLFEDLCMSDKSFVAGIDDGHNPLATLIDLYTMYGEEELEGVHLLDHAVSRKIGCIGRLSFLTLMRRTGYNSTSFMKPRCCLNFMNPGCCNNSIRGAMYCRFHHTLGSQADDIPQFDCPSFDKSYLFRIAVGYKDWIAAEWLLNDTDTHANVEAGFRLHTAFHLLVDLSDEQSLIDGRHDPHEPTQFKILRAVFNRDNTDINLAWSDEKDTPLMCAIAIHSSREVFDLLLTHPNVSIDAQIVTQMDSVPRDDLGVACRKTRSDLDINAVNGHGATALHYAAECNEAVLVMLLDYPGIIVNVLDEDGETPLDVAMKCGKSRMVDMLHSCGGVRGEEMELPVSRFDDANPPWTPTISESGSVRLTKPSEVLSMVASQL